MPIPLDTGSGRCDLCNMTVRNVKAHWKLNHKTKKSSKSGFTGFTTVPSTDKSASLSVKKESTTPDIISRIVPPMKSLVTRSTGHHNIAVTSTYQPANANDFSIERNLSLLHDLLDEEDGGVPRKDIEDIIHSGGKILYEKSFEFKLKIMGLIRMKKKHIKGTTGPSRYKECPDCHQQWDYRGSSTSRLGTVERREYLEHVKNCGLDVGIGGGVTMKVIQNVVCEPKIECLPDASEQDNSIPQGMLSGFIKTELMDLIKQEPQTTYNDYLLGLIKSENIDDNEEPYVQMVETINSKGLIKSENLDYNEDPDGQMMETINANQHKENRPQKIKKETDDTCLSRTQEENSSEVNNKDLSAFIKYEIKEETESLVRKDTESIVRKDSESIGRKDT